MTRDGSLAHSSPPGQAAGPASWWARLRGRLADRRRRGDTALALYRSVVEQARQPVFYAAWGVPDSRDGRLELVTLHALLVMRRLRAEGPVGEALGQALFDVMFADLDRHLREWGVGDLSVGKEIRKLAESFFGRAAAIDPLLAGHDLEALDEVLRRNVYTDAAAPDPGAVRRLSTYLCAQDRWLAAQDAEPLLAGRAEFAPPL
jgi:cytochrome b pre-mRNA-processing protein 3